MVEQRIQSSLWLDQTGVEVLLPLAKRTDGADAEQRGTWMAPGSLCAGGRAGSPAALLASARTWHLIQTMVRRSSRVLRSLRRVVLAYITEHWELASFLHRSCLFTVNTVLGLRLAGA